jgi:hypothetical protein
VTTLNPSAMPLLKTKRKYRSWSYQVTRKLSLWWAHLTLKLTIRIKIILLVNTIMTTTRQPRILSKLWVDGQPRGVSRITKTHTSLLHTTPTLPSLSCPNKLRSNLFSINMEIKIVRLTQSW